MSAVEDWQEIRAGIERWAELGAPVLPPGMFYRVRESRDGLISVHFEVSIQKHYGKRGRSHSVGDVWLFPKDFNSGREGILAACLKCIEKAKYRDPLAFSSQYREVLGYVGDHA